MSKLKNLNDDCFCMAVKDRDGFYFCGYNQWDKQIRKAKLYHQYRMAKETRDDTRFMEHDTHIVRVRITELEEVNYDD